MNHLGSTFALLLAMTLSLMAETIKSLPIPTGSFQVGVAKYDLIDAYRKELNYPQGRLIPIQIYFPMKKGRHTLHPKIYEERTAGNWPPLQVEVYAQKADLCTLNVSSKHPLILLNHGDGVAMTDYAFLAEDLASNGYIVVAIQHQLKGDPEEAKFWEERSISRFGKVIDNILFVYEWMKENQATLFKGSLDADKVGLIGHSMGGNSLLLFASRASNTFKKKKNQHLLPHQNNQEIKEAIIVLDNGGFPYPSHRQFPLFLLLAEEREAYQKQSGAYQEMVKIGHKVNYYKGSKHISFMDHGYVDPENPVNPGEHYFNGTFKERKAFFNKVRTDIRLFLHENGIMPSNSV